MYVMNYLSAVASRKAVVDEKLVKFSQNEQQILWIHFHVLLSLPVIMYYVLMYLE